MSGVLGALDGGGVVITAAVAVLIVIGVMVRTVLGRRVRRRLGSAVSPTAVPEPSAALPLGERGVQVVGDASALTPAQHEKLRALGIALPASAAASPSAAARAAGSRDLLVDIERLVALRDSGVLTSDEFEKQKLRVLETEP